jgi:hypothetical protein
MMIFEESGENIRGIIEILSWNFSGGTDENHE